LIASADSYVSEAEYFAAVSQADSARENYELAVTAYLDAAANFVRASDQFLDLAARCEEPLPPEWVGKISLARAGRAAAFMEMRQLAPDQAWFWTEEWQAGEREVEANKAEGHSTFHGSTEEFIAAMDARRVSRADSR
jgi:hypothetical protein